MKFVLLLAFLFMWLANPITGFPGFNNPEKWMKRAIRKLQRKTNAYGTMIASNTDEISNTAGFISTIDQCENNYINDPDNGLSCCFEDNLNKGQCLCNGMTIDDTSNTGTCCMENQEHPDNCLCSGTDMDDPTNPGNCCFANSGQCLCTGNYTDVPSKRCFNLDWKGDGICDDQNNHGGCNFDGGDCCGDNVDTALCTQCQCLEEEAPLPNAVGCCYRKENNSQECLCTGTQIDDPETPGSCCLDIVDNPGNCYRTCPDDCTNSSQGICEPSTGICDCKPGFAGHNCANRTCPDDCTNSSQGICDTSTGICDCKPGFVGHNCTEACTANQITNADTCQDCPLGEVPDVMSNLTACVAAPVPLDIVGCTPFREQGAFTCLTSIDGIIDGNGWAYHGDDYGGWPFYGAWVIFELAGSSVIHSIQLISRINVSPLRFKIDMNVENQWVIPNGLSVQEAPGAIIESDGFIKLDSPVTDLTVLFNPVVNVASIRLNITETTAGNNNVILHEFIVHGVVPE